MMVMPLLLVLLDWWPLARLSWRSVIEKWPYAALGALAALVAYIGQRNIGAALPPTQETIGYHAVLALYSLGLNARLLLWPDISSGCHAAPVDLPASDPTLLAHAGLGVAVLLGTLIALRFSRPAALASCFLLMTLLPTLGLVRFTSVVASDKYAYFGLAVVTIVAGWALAALLRRVGTPAPRTVIGGAVVLVLALLGWRQQQVLHVWRDSEPLNRHMLAVALFESWPARAALANLLARQGRVSEALNHYEIALATHPREYRARTNYAVALADAGQLDAALAEHERSLLDGGDRHPTAHAATARTFLRAGRTEAALAHYARAVELLPGDIDTRFAFGYALMQAARNADAITQFEFVLDAQPQHAKARANLGMLLLPQQPAAAAEHLQQAVAAFPDNVDLRGLLAEAHLAAGRTPEAVAELRKLLRIAPGHPVASARLAELTGAAESQPAAPP